MVLKCDKCGKEINEEQGTGLIGALQNLGSNMNGGKSEFTLCKLCSLKFNVYKLEFFEVKK